jgi:hypothetical protein
MIMQLGSQFGIYEQRSENDFTKPFNVKSDKKTFNCGLRGGAVG